MINLSYGKFVTNRVDFPEAYTFYGDYLVRAYKKTILVSKPKNVKKTKKKLEKRCIKYLKSIGGLEKINEINKEKAQILYDFLDNSKMFNGTVEKEVRSLMNVPFVTDSDELNAKFIKEATEAGFVNLKGHRSVGGMRASIYNAMPIEGVEKLVEFMAKFEEENA